MAEGGLEMSTLKAGVSFPLQNLTPLPGQTVSNLDDMPGHPSVKPEEISRARKLNLPPIKNGQPGPATDSYPKAESPRVEQKSAAGKGVDNAGHTRGNSRRTGTRTLAIKDGVKETQEEDESNETSFSNVLSKVVKILLAVVLFLAMSCGILATKLSLLVMVHPLRSNVSENAICNVECLLNETLCHTPDSDDNVSCFLNEAFCRPSDVANNGTCFLNNTLCSTSDANRDNVICFLNETLCRTSNATDNVTCFLNETFCRMSDTSATVDTEELAIACDRVTTVVTLSLAIMVPYAGVLLWSLWEGAFNSRAPWPRWHACLVVSVGIHFNIYMHCRVGYRYRKYRCRYGLGPGLDLNLNLDLTTCKNNAETMVNFATKDSVW